jgi:epsilon-lactone hydrolase
VSQQQRDAVDQLLRDAPLDFGGVVAEQRVIFEDMMAAIPRPADVTTSSGSLGGIPVVNVDVAGADRARVIFYLHGGAYAIGTAASSVGLASDLARRARARLVTVDYRLAPEHPYPAAIDDSVAAYRADCSTAASPRPRSRLLASPPVRAWPPRPWWRSNALGYRSRARRC